MVAGRRSDKCEACGAPYGRWIASLGMVFCGTCERAGSGHPVREPVLVGDVLAGMTAAVTFAARSGKAVPEARNPSSGTCDRGGTGAERHRAVRGRRNAREQAEPVDQVPDRT